MSLEKIPLTPPLVHNNTLITDFKQEADLFNNFFDSQCTTFADIDVIPHIQSNKTFKNIQKGHGPDAASTCMIKICNSALVKLLLLIFQNCLNCSTFPDIWKKSNIYPVHKKMTNKLLTITDLFHHCLYLGKYLKNLFLNLFLSILMNTNCSQNINPVSDQMIHAQINYSL